MGARKHAAWVTLAAALPLTAPRAETTPKASAARAPTVDFAREVAPVLVARCEGCHGPDKKRGGLRLDSRAATLAGGDSGPALVPGKRAESLLYKMVAGLSDDVMPPKGDPLTKGEVDAIGRWIDAGAPWPDGGGHGARKVSHWAFVSVRRPTVPTVRNAGWVKSPIDAFVLRSLEGRGIAPSPEADRATLLRRMTLDLTGLPPTPAELEAFVADGGPDAYARQVDRLLASPHFGEQWAGHWLDLARYADTDGYEKDFHRPHAWRWRQWAIDAINRDQRFDEFTRDQIAGDLLPRASTEQRVATGFHRNSLLNREGGVDLEEDRTKIVVDRVSTVGTTWLGLTVACAECHTHKFDPITQREFYQLYAFFDSVDDRDIRAPLGRDRRTYDAGQAALESAKARYVAAPDPAVEAWAAKIAALPEIWKTPAAGDYELPTFGANNGANLYLQEDGSFLVTGMVEAKTHYIMMLNTRLDGITGVRLEAMTDEMLPRLGPGHAPDGAFVLHELRVESASLAKVNDLSRHAIAAVHADYEAPGHPARATIDGKEEGGGWAVDVPGLAMSGLDRAAVYIPKERIRHGKAGTRLKVTLVQSEGKSRSLGRFRVSYTTAPAATLAAQAVPERIRALARIPAARRTVDERVTLRRYYDATFRPQAPALRTFTAALAAAPGTKGEVQAPVIAERRTPRRTQVHVRGNFLDKGAVVEPGTLAALHPLQPTGARATRLDLARWLTDPDNPLTARVTVNQLWRQLFGEGLVTSVGDFGTQGDPPSHPALLDWLASELVARGWSRKAILREMLLSSTYRQSAATRRDLLSVDAKNRLLARQNRFRLPAENVRDQLLAAGGLLEPGIGGPSVKPEIPRRGLYVERRRSQPEYMLTSFDAPGATQTCARRERSNTPLQALLVLNDELFVRAARGLAARALAEGGDTRDAVVRRAFLHAVSRPPMAAESTALVRLHHRARKLYAVDLAHARALAGTLPETVGTRPVADLAAWVVVARAILNLDEVVTRP